MSFIGNVPAEAYSPVAKDTFSGNSSTTDFTLSIPATTNSVNVYVENVAQEPTTAYTISGTTLSFTAAPVTGTNNIYVIHRGPAVQQVTPPAGVAIDASTITGTGDMNIDSGTLFVDVSANAVGIGTTSPDEDLHISNAGSVRVKITSTDNTETGAGIFLTTEDGGSVVSEATVRTDNAGNLSFFTGTTGGGSEKGFFDASGNFAFNSGYGSVATAYGCRAWVNFNGTGTVAIREDGNVSSITDNATGNYTVNFTTAMPDANYNAVFGCISDGLRFALEQGDAPVRSSTQLKIYVLSGANAPVDNSIISAAIFR